MRRCSFHGPSLSQDDYLLPLDISRHLAVLSRETINLCKGNVAMYMLVPFKLQSDVVYWEINVSRICTTVRFYVD